MPPVPAPQVVGVGSHGTLQDSVVGMAALDHFIQARRFDDGGGVLKCQGRDIMDHCGGEKVSHLEPLVSMHQLFKGNVRSLGRSSGRCR